MAKIKVKKNLENPEPTLVLAEAIINISDAFDRLKKSGLTEYAIIVLIVDSCPTIDGRKISKTIVRTVLETIRELKGRYCRRQE